MPALTVTDSPNIASLNSNIQANLCTGIFYIDLLSSIWIGSGASNVEGASVKITNPYGVVIKNYPTSGYDIYPPMTSDVEVSIPTQANNYQYGSYIVTVRLTDEDGTEYEVTKNVSICAPDSKNKTRDYGSLSAIMDGDCTTGKVTIIVDTPPTYKGFASDSQVNDFTLLYPTVSEVAPEEDITLNNFSAQLYEGGYKLTGTICAHYSYGDNVFANVNYKVKKIKNIRCLLDRACIASRLAQLQLQLDSDCSDAEKIETQNTIIQTLFLLTTIDALIKDGQDGSEFIDKLETVLGCVCTCNCAEGTPIIPTVTTNDFEIEGCNVSSETAGLTTTYTIENYSYVTEITDNGGAVVITAPTLDDCTQTQTITFNIAVVYAQIKAQIEGDTENNFWAEIINTSWDELDITCLGITEEIWEAYTFEQRGQAIINKLCDGGNCDGEIEFVSAVASGADVVLTWANVTAPFEVLIYMDGILKGTVLGSVVTFTITGAADGNSHEYVLMPRCSNGEVATAVTGEFAFFGCPAIAPPTVSSTSVADADCPYDLTALVSGLPVGITAEYHNLPNTNASSLVADATQVSDGSYYIYAKNADGCYSLPVNVIIVCSTETACSAPQNMQLTALTGSFRVRFQSAAYPPPLNSYTVKRRLSSAPDVSGSYTTIGTPTWNAVVSRWEIRDLTAVNNTLYTYRAISNCASSAPYIDFEFANIVCPTITFTFNTDTIDYEFTNSGGEIDKYETSIYEADGVTLIHTDTHIPAFPAPISGTFIYLTAGTNYVVKNKIYIGTYSTNCLSQSVTTDYETATLTISYTEGEFTAILSSAVDDDISILAEVMGSTSVDCSALTATDVTSTLEILAGATSDTVAGDTPLNCTINSYNFISPVIINGNARSNLSLFVVGSVLVSLTITPSVCTTPYNC